MKILLIDVYNFNKGGAETVCFNTGKMLEEHGHEVIYFTLKWPQNKPSAFNKYFPESKETRRGPFKQVKNLINYFYHFEATRKIEQLIHNEKPDLAHIHLLWGQITPSIFPILRSHKIPILFTVHDYRMVCPAYTFRDGSGRICEDCQGRYFYRCFTHTCCKGSKLMSAVMAAELYFRNVFFHPAKYVDGLIYVSQFAKNIQEKYMSAVKAIPNVVLYNSTSKLANVPKSMPSERYFLFFGRLSHEKGVKTLLEAFGGLPQCRLKIAGAGPLEQELKTYVRAHNMSNVDFLGYRQGQELEELVQKAYFVVVPSEWYENNPMTVIESYSSGVPVIGAKIGGIPEIVVEGTTGYLFESGRADMLRVVIEKADTLSMQVYAKLSAGALDFAVEHFSPECYYPRLMAFYQRFLPPLSVSLSNYEQPTGRQTGNKNNPCIE